MTFNSEYRCACGMFVCVYCALATVFIRFLKFNIFEYLRRFNNKFLEATLFIIFIIVQVELFEKIMKKYDVSDKTIIRIFMAVYSSSIICR